MPRGQPITPRGVRRRRLPQVPSPNISEVQSYNDILGHQGDMNATLFYFDFYLIDSIESQ